jgi:hypothetical protein
MKTTEAEGGKGLNDEFIFTVHSTESQMDLSTVFCDGVAQHNMFFCLNVFVKCNMIVRAQ